MRTVTEHLNRILDVAVRPAPVRVAVADAQGLRSAEEVVAGRPLPVFDQAAVDGYAVRSVDVAGATQISPMTVPVVGEISAGSRQPLRLQPGQAVRVAAGAPLPTLADAVAPAAWTDSGSARLSVHRSVPSGGFVRRVGEDVQSGDVAVREGDIVGSAQVAMLAAAGRDKLLVHPRPRVSVVSVGDELVEVSRSASSGQVADVCSHAVVAAAREAGAETNRPRTVGGSGTEIRGAVEDLLPASEIIVICGAGGGATMAEATSGLSDLGGIDATRIAMHPGSAQGYGRLGADAVPVFLVPSHPATALVLFEVFVRPLIRLALGQEPRRRSWTARLTSPVSSPVGRRSYIPSRLLREDDGGELLAQPLGSSGSHLLAVLAEANALAVVGEDVTELTVGEQIELVARGRG
ncbi:molybdotransferase-like divisome protein Glp [Pseudonocardia sp. HH130630-07]|uniref:molybdotransferase-like divisome protein Glp n=1 Tax=Pseudonocardia sp. HH130630-07 TaxID=1690815 RepID=UPI000814C57E|nr:gephyrin-like molybdotransferase Glp [Pseudonocardia sp. HH130630-07]ANY06126.1 molybdopterin molybdenumtransferase [Pseudonocardia sp. HH130630-07]